MPADDRFEQTTHAPLRYVVKSCRVLAGIFTDTCTGIYAIGVIEQSLSMLSVRGNNDNDDAEYYVNHLMFSVN